MGPFLQRPKLHIKSVIYCRRIYPSRDVSETSGDARCIKHVFFWQYDRKDYGLDTRYIRNWLSVDFN